MPLYEVVHNGRNNIIELFVLESGSLRRLNGVVFRGVLRDLEGTLGGDIDSDVTGEGLGQIFDWTSDGHKGILRLELGSLGLPEGAHRVQLILYDGSNPEGIAWQTFTLRVKP